MFQTKWSYFGYPWFDLIYNTSRCGCTHQCWNANASPICWNVYESVYLHRSWVFSKNGSRTIANRRINTQDDPQLKSKETIHLFSAGPNSYRIPRIIDLAKQVVCASTNSLCYFTQLVRDNHIYGALLPFTKEEFDKHVASLGVFKHESKKHWNWVDMVKYAHWAILPLIMTAWYMPLLESLMQITFLATSAFAIGWRAMIILPF